MTREPWLCPHCKKYHAPHVDTCPGESTKSLYELYRENGLLRAPQGQAAQTDYLIRNAMRDLAYNKSALS